METGKKIAEQNNSPEQQVQQDSSRQQTVAMQTMGLNITPVNMPNVVLDNYKEIKSALTGPIPSWVLPALNPSAASTNPKLFPKNLKD